MPIDKHINEVKTRILDFECESNDLKTILYDFLSRESKLIRTITASLLFSGNINDEQYKIMTATELIHNASLIHDDAIDGSILRRGKSTLNIEFDNKLSVIAGDYLISRGVNELLKLDNNDVLNIFFETISKMCEGESLQYFSRGKISTIEEYLKKTQYKTAELFKACFVSMALYSEPQIINEAREFAINFGMAFQIKNDLDDYRLGVKNSSDIQNGIYTAPVIYLNSIEDNNSAIEKTLNLIDNYCKRAKLVLDIFEDNEHRRCLTGLVDNLCK